MPTRTHLLACMTRETRSAFGEGDEGAGGWHARSGNSGSSQGASSMLSKLLDGSGGHFEGKLWKEQSQLKRRGKSPPPLEIETATEDERGRTVGLAIHGGVV